MDYYDDYGFRPYVSVAARRAQAARELAKLQKKGRTISPVAIQGRTIARTFWGEAWCDNLERYSDYANRLPRGRTYVRNGSVVHLQIQAGRVTALVSGSTMYEVNVTVGPVPRARWNAICTDCSGAIDSLVELLQGRFSKGVMTRLCEEKTGLFPSPKDIVFTCSCPDWASMCKHVAAVLYGIGARLDHQPQLLFRLRNVDQQDLIANAGSDLSKKGKRPASAKVLASDDLSEMFGIDIVPPTTPTQTPASVVPTKRSEPTRPAKSNKPAPRGERQRLTLKKRQAIAERMRKYWADRRAPKRKRKAAKL
ncbi:MAG: hypothetical protein H0X67_14535 [Acidobacteria bacterium]|nr:hypothetical protein [Acidobacteriota bacterium]